MKNIKIKSELTDKPSVYIIYNKTLKEAYIGSSKSMSSRYNYNAESNMFEQSHHSNFSLDDSITLNPYRWEFKVLKVTNDLAEMKYYEGYYIMLTQSRGYKTHNSRTFDYNKSIHYIKGIVEFNEDEKFIIATLNKSKMELRKLAHEEGGDDYKRNNYIFQIKNIDNRLKYMKVKRSILNKIN